MKNNYFLKITSGIKTVHEETVSRWVSSVFSSAVLNIFVPRHETNLRMKLCPFTHLLALPPQGGKEVTEGADALQLNDKKEQQEDCTLH